MLLCNDPTTLFHLYYMAEEYYRVTPEELKELFCISLAQARGSATVPGIDGRMTVRTRFVPKQRQEKHFRAAVAYALALNRLVPEAQRFVPLTAPCANDSSVPRFADAELINPLTPEVRTQHRIHARATIAYPKGRGDESIYHT